MRGAMWLREFPSRLAVLEEEWELVDADGPFPGSRAAFVAPVRNREGAELVLKILPLAHWASHEAEALAHWAGRGAVRLRSVSPEHGALLMERAIPGAALAVRCVSDDRAATAMAASVIADLRTADHSASSLPDLTTWIDALGQQTVARGWRHLEDAWNRASALAGDLLAGAERMVLHGDLQHYNILSARRSSWLAVDPKGILGPREAEAAALLRNPREVLLSHPDPIGLLADRVDILTERLGDDPRLLVLWGYVLAVVAGAWALEDRDGEDDVRRWTACADLIWQLARARSIA